MPKIAVAQTPDPDVPKNPFLRDEPKGYPHDYVPNGVWPDQKMRELYYARLSEANTAAHSTNKHSLNHVYYYDSEVNFAGAKKSGVPEIDVIDDLLADEKWAQAYRAADKYIRSGALNDFTDDALKIRVLSSVVIALRNDGYKADPIKPTKRLPFSSDIARDLQAHIYNLSNSPIILAQVFATGLGNAVVKMMQPGTIFDQNLRRVRELSRSSAVLTQEEAQEKYTRTRTLITEINDKMDQAFGTKPTPVILDTLPPEYKHNLTGMFFPIDTRPKEADEFNKLATKHFGNKFMFLSYSNSNLLDLLNTVAHEKMHDVQSQFIQDLTKGRITPDDPKFPLAQLYALNYVLYSSTDNIACEKNMSERCYQTDDEYRMQPLESNAFKIGDGFERVINQIYNPAPTTGPFAVKPGPPPASALKPKP